MQGKYQIVKTDLIAKTLGGNDCDLITDTLVGLEVEGKFGVVALDDDLGGFLDRLGGCQSCPKTDQISLSSRKYLRANATHVGDIGC